MAITHEIRKDCKGGLIIVELTARKAIIAHCKECMGFNANEVKRCSDPLCALFPFKTHGTAKSTV